MPYHGEEKGGVGGVCGSVQQILSCNLVSVQSPSLWWKLSHFKLKEIVSREMDRRIIRKWPSAQAMQVFLRFYEHLTRGQTPDTDEHR